MSTDNRIQVIRLLDSDWTPLKWPLMYCLLKFVFILKNICYCICHLCTTCTFLDEKVINDRQRNCDMIGRYPIMLTFNSVLWVYGIHQSLLDLGFSSLTSLRFSFYFMRFICAWDQSEDMNDRRCSELWSAHQRSENRWG